MKELGAFFTSKKHATTQAEFALYIQLAEIPNRGKEHINTLEMRAVEQALLYWGRSWKGK